MVLLPLLHACLAVVSQADSYDSGAYDYQAGSPQYQNYDSDEASTIAELERKLAALYRKHHGSDYSYNSYNYNYGAGGVENKVPSESVIEPKSGGYGPPQMESKTKYVPVVVKKKKKKQKILTINKGVFIRGGTQVFGKFKSLKACMKACGATPTCFAGDYNPWVGKCYFHSNTTACNNMNSHSKITHFKKVPCEVTDAPRGRIILGAMHHATTFQKGVDSLSTCLKKCAGAGMGISSAVPVDLAATAILGNLPLCYGINYDFGTHKCYWITNLHPRLPDAVRTIFSICPLTAAIDVRVPVDLQPNPSVITVILCPIRTTPAG